MATVKFLGLVLPNRGLNITNLAPMDLVYASGLRASVTIQVQNSALTVECELNRYDRSEFEMFHLHILHISRACVDMVAFSSGNGFSTVIEYFIDPEGIKMTVQAHDETLAGICTIPANDLFAIVTDFEVSLILHTLTSTLDEPYLWPINCESMAHLVAPNEKQPVGRWRRIREALNVSEPYLKFITEASTRPRHGHLAEILRPDPKHIEVRKRAWIVMHRFLEYRRRGSSGPLPLAEFRDL